MVQSKMGSQTNLLSVGSKTAPSGVLREAASTGRASLEEEDPG